MKGQGGSSVLLKVNFHPPYSLYGRLFCMRFPGVGYRNGISALHPRAAHAYMSPPPLHDTFIHSDALRGMPGWVVFKLGAETSEMEIDFPSSTKRLGLGGPLTMLIIHLNS